MAEEEHIEPPPPEEDAVEEGAPAWALTFGDMMSLLLCFFVLMFSMSEIKVEKFLIAADSLRSGLGHGASKMKASAGMGGSSALDTDVLTSDPAPYDITIAMDDVDDVLEFIGQTLESFVANQGAEGKLGVHRDDSGVTLNIRDIVLFDSGSAALRAQSRELMADLGTIVSEFAMPIVVAGHTDDRPIRTAMFPSNWELSSARAATVARIVLERGLPPRQIHVEGYAEFEPRADNDSEEGRAQNRRVEIRYTRDNVISEMVEEKRREEAAEATAPLGAEAETQGTVEPIP